MVFIISVSLRNYVLVIFVYWGFIIIDGVLWMLVLFYFYKIGYIFLEIVFLFLFYEVFGIFINFFGGWIGL